MVTSTSSYSFGARQDKERMTNILGELFDKSSGVFLWVILACMSILEGIANFDSISELERRMQELPKELEDLFQDMILRTDPRYRAEGAQLLWIWYWSQTCSWKIPTIGLALTDSLEMKMNALDTSVEFMPEGRRQMVLAVEGRIRSRCSGLLEIAARSISLDNTCFCGAENDMIVNYSHDKMVDSEVTVIHRSVSEFLEEVTINGQDCLSSQNYSYAMLAYIALRLIAIARYDEHQSLADSYLGKFLQSANSPGCKNYPGALIPLKILETSIQDQSARYWTDSRRVKNPSIMERVIRELTHHGDHIAALTLLRLAIEGGCLELTRLLVEQNSESFKALLNDSYALHLALVRPALGTLLTAQPSLPMLCYLLESGCGVEGTIKDHDRSLKPVSEVWSRVFKTHFESTMADDPMVLQIARYFPSEQLSTGVSQDDSDQLTAESELYGGLNFRTLIMPQPSDVPQHGSTEHCTTENQHDLKMRGGCGIPYILYSYTRQVFGNVTSWMSIEQTTNSHTYPS